MVKKNTSGIALYKEDLKQSIEELTDLQRKMLSLTLSDLDPEQLKLDKIYPVSVDSFPEFRSQNAEEAYETLIESAQSLFDKFVMIRGGIEAQTEDEIEFYRWLSQLRYSDKTYSVCLIFSNMVKSSLFFLFLLFFFYFSFSIFFSPFSNLLYQTSKHLPQ